MNTQGLEYFTLFWVVIIGLCLGSFYNVVILRSLKNESIVSPPSKCPKCGNKLKPWHNIPVLSYILLGGKCAFCQKPISIQYPIVEILTGGLFGWIFMHFGFKAITLFAMLWVSCLIIMTVTDIKEKLVDCGLAIIMAAGGLIYNIINAGWLGLRDSVVGAIIGVIIIEAIAGLGIIMKKGRAMGEADTYVAGAFGAIAGFNVLWVLFYSFVVSMVFALPQFWYGRYKANDSLTLFVSALFFFSIFLAALFDNPLWAIALLVLSGIALAVLTIKSMRESSELNLLPFVPSLAIGFLYYLMFVL